MPAPLDEEPVVPNIPEDIAEETHVPAPSVSAPRSSRVASRKAKLVSFLEEQIVDIDKQIKLLQAKRDEFSVNLGVLKRL